MKHTAKAFYFLAWITVGFSVLAGCVTVQPFPQSARAGDTITLAVGSPDDPPRSEAFVTARTWVVIAKAVDQTVPQRSELDMILT